MIENYKSLSVLFYDLDKPFPPREEYLFYKYFLEKYNSHILEPMCGSGRFLIPFLKDGFDIDAFDGSTAMLTSLNNRLINNNIQKKVLFSLFENYIFSKLYNLIYIPSASLSLLHRRSDFKETLVKIYNHLTVGGSFIFEVETPAILEQDGSDFKLIANHFISIDQNNKILGSFINTNYDDQVLTISCRYDLIQNDCIKKTEFEDISVRLFFYEEIVSLLESVGFMVMVYKNFKKEIYHKYNKKEKLLIIEAIKII